MRNLKGQDNRPFAMTPGGVVVKGLSAAARREIPQELLESDLVLVGGKVDPTASHVRVLGTVAPPARQNVSGEPIRFIKRARRLLVSRWI